MNENNVKLPEAKVSIGKLMRKELKLALHPTVIFFWLLSAMLLIPNYPYYVILFYSSLGLFFVCLTGRENHDIEYSLCLPIRKRDIVKGRILLAVFVEMVQLVICIPFAILRQSMPMPGNMVGMDANIAFFGLSLILLGLYNLVFFTMYYKRPDKVGKSFAICGILSFVFIALAETLTHVVPFFREQLDVPDPEYLAPKLIVLALGAIVYLICTVISYKLSAASFEKLDF